MLTRVIILFLLACFSMIAVAEQQVSSLRASADQSATRIVIDLSDRVEYQVFTLSNPHRVVVDIADTTLKTELNQRALTHGPIQHVRFGTRQGNDLRLVLDVNQKVTPKAFLLEPQQGVGHRLVIDFPGVGKSAEQLTAKKKAPTHTKPKHVSKTAPQSYRDVVVVIDAGHGGKDVGAIGATGTYEKDVVLAVSKKLAALINAQPGMLAVLTREGDQFLRLRDRTRIARENHADLFISIHAEIGRAHV